MEKSESTAVPELDLVFVCDTTGSMGSYIENAKKNIRSIIEAVKASEKRDVRFALVAYKDYTDKYVSKTFPWTTKTQEAFSYVAEMSADGGGDTPEAVAEALNDVNNLEYRKKAVRICVIVADAPPHGFEESGDRYPDGGKLDIMQIVNDMVTKEIIIYSVGVEPVLGNSKWGRDFFKAIASMTGGKYIALGQANLLPQVIVGGAEEELKMEKLSELMKEEETLLRAANSNITEEELHKRIAENLANKGIKCTTLKVTDFGDGAPTEESKFIETCKTKLEVKNYLQSRTKVSQPTSYSSSMAYSPRSGGRFEEEGEEDGYIEDESKSKKSYKVKSKSIVTSAPKKPSYEKQTAICDDNDDMDYEKVKRVMNRKAKATCK